MKTWFILKMIGGFSWNIPRSITQKIKAHADGKYAGEEEKHLLGFVTKSTMLMHFDKFFKSIVFHKSNPA